MGETKINSALFLCMLLCMCACEVEEPEEEKHFLLSETTKQWFTAQSGSISMRSTNGLTDVYKMEHYRREPSVEINGERGIGERISLDFKSSIGNLDFGFSVFNGSDIECVEISYANWNSPEYVHVTQQFLAYSPYSSIDFYYFPVDTGARSLWLSFIGDTTINSIEYKDIFVSKLKHNTYNNQRAVKDIYLSKSSGLVAFVTIGNVIRYKD